VTYDKVKHYTISKELPSETRKGIRNSQFKKSGIVLKNTFKASRKSHS